MRNDEANLEICSSTAIHADRVAFAKERLPDMDRAAELAELYKLFADQTRLRILSILQATELCVCDIAVCLDMNQSAVSHQLAALKRARLVRARREGKTVFYALADEHVRAVLDVAQEHIDERKDRP